MLTDYLKTNITQRSIVRCLLHDAGIPTREHRSLHTSPQSLRTNSLSLLGEGWGEGKNGENNAIIRDFLLD